MAGEVNLSVKLNRSYFPIVDQPQLIYALVEVVPGDVVASVRMPLNFSLVLDQSGSMKDEGKLDQLKQAVKYVIDLLEDDDHISIVTFSGNAVCNLRLVGGIQPRRVWRVVPAIGDLGHGPLSDRAISARLGELEKNVGQALLVELLCSPRPAGRYRLAQAEASYDVPQLGVTSERTRSDVLVEFTPNPALSSQVNPEVMNIVERVQAFKLQTMALNEAAAGNVAGAQQKLANAVTMLLNQGETELAEQLQAETQRLAQGQDISSEGRKTIQFKSSKTVRLGGS